VYFFKGEIYACHFVAIVPYGIKTASIVIATLDKTQRKEIYWPEGKFSTTRKTKINIGFQDAIVER
jgi:hypothetical protein